MATVQGDHGISEQPQQPGLSAHLTEPNQKVLGDLPEDVHVHDSSLVATQGAPVHHSSLSCRDQDVPFLEELQAPPLHCC